MDTPTLKIRIKELQGQVGQYANHTFKQKNSTFSVGSFFTPSKIYILIPILLLVLLLFWKPNFITEEYGDEQGNTFRKLSIKKLFMYWIILSSALILGLFGYNYKKAQQ